MGISGAKEMAENKLILLYIMDSSEVPISDFQITQMILGNHLMNYFVFQQLLDELNRDGLIEKSEETNKAFYSTTPNGKKTLGLFESRLPDGIKSTIKNVLDSKKSEIKKEVSIIADYTPESENKYTVECEVREGGFSLISLKIAVGSKEDAKLACANWKNYAAVIYSDMMQTLTKK